MMKISILIEFYILIYITINNINFLQADPASCRKQIECYICDSRETQECEDARNFSQTSIPTRLCDDYCLKVWTRENDSVRDDDTTGTVRYVRRDCHKIFQFQIKKTETCYKHKIHRTDSLCLCSSDRCNSSINIRLKRSNYCIVLFFVFIFYCIDVYSLIISY